MTNYNDGKWHGWNGGECTVHPETVVEIVTAQRGLVEYQNRRAGITMWNDKVEPVVAFRVVKEYRDPPKPREIWMRELEINDLTGPLKVQVYDVNHIFGATLFREVLP